MITEIVKIVTVIIGLGYTGTWSWTFSSGGGRKHRQYSFLLPRQAELACVAGYIQQDDLPARGLSVIQLST